MQRFADFVDKLAKTPDGEGSLLDHSLLMYGSNMSNSDRHNNYPLPNILVGGACGALKGGQHITLPEYTTFSNLHLTVVNKAGLEMKSIGDSTGEIAGVVADALVPRVAATTRRCRDGRCCKASRAERRGGVRARAARARSRVRGRRGPAVGDGGARPQSC